MSINFSYLKEVKINVKYSEKLDEALEKRGFKWVDNLFDQLYGQYKNWNYQDILVEKDRLLKPFETRNCILKLGFASDFNDISGSFDGEKIYLFVPRDFFKICIDENLNYEVRDIVKELIAHEDIHLQSKEGFKYEKKSPDFRRARNQEELDNLTKNYLVIKQEINAYARQATFQLEKYGIDAEEFLRLKQENKLEEKAFELKDKGKNDEVLAIYYSYYNKGLITMKMLSRFLRRVYYFLMKDEKNDDLS